MSLKLVQKILEIHREMWKLKGHAEEMILHAQALNIKYAGGHRAGALDTKDAGGGVGTIDGSVSPSNIKQNLPSSNFHFRIDFPLFLKFLCIELFLN